MLKGMLTGCCCALLTAAPAALAHDGGYAPDTVEPSLETGVAFGGDRLAGEHAIVGGDNSLYAGNSAYVVFGPQFNFADSHWSLKAMGGIQHGFILSHVTSPTFTRYPLDLLLLDNHGDWHWGFGLSYHLNPKLRPQGDGPDFSFHNALGGVLEAQYQIFGIRYTSIRYTSSGACPEFCRYDGSTLGLYINFVF